MSVRLRTFWFPAVLSVAIVLSLSACGSNSSATGTKSATFVFAAVAPFTGPDADFGTTAMAGCVPAAKLINQAGGVLGHKVKCLPFDTRGDPADAVPAVRKLLATTPNLVAVVGPTSDDTSATASIFNQANIPFFPSTGQAIFNHNPYPYFYRLTPADDIAGYAMAIWAHQRGYTRGAAVFGNDIGSQGTVPTLTRGFKKLGGTMVINVKIALDQSSYRSEVERVASSHPQVIFTEVDPQTAATFFSEFKQLHGLLPVIGADPTLDPTWFKTVANTIGARELAKLFTAENPVGASRGPGWKLYETTLLASGAQVRDPGGYTSDGVAEARYNSANLVALAMLAARSAKPPVFRSYIGKLTEPKPGAVRVYDFAAGKKALLAGKQVQYVGVGGPIIFDRWHNAPGKLEVDRFTPNAGVVKVSDVTAAEVTSIEK
ncbi:MAG: ABC transporter substrate-binding protein [Chloroflexota bacterium]|nr:ABC transporter substrate-binding protein [Chloroflexota bacterium]